MFGGVQYNVDEWWNVFIYSQGLWNSPCQSDIYPASRHYILLHRVSCSLEIHYKTLEMATKNLGVHNLEAEPWTIQPLYISLGDAKGVFLATDYQPYSAYLISTVLLCTYDCWSCGRWFCVSYHFDTLQNIRMYPYVKGLHTSRRSDEPYTELKYLKSSALKLILRCGSNLF